MIKPYWTSDNGRIVLYHGRCEDVLPQIEGVALTVTSPPYNTLGGANVAFKTGSLGRPDRAGAWARKMVASRYADEAPEAEYQEQQRRMAMLVAEASRPDGSFFYNHKVRYRNKVPVHPLDIVRTFDGWTYRQEVIWARPGGLDQAGSRFISSDERIYWLVRDMNAYRTTGREREWTTVWRFSPLHGSWHPAPFPAEIPWRAIMATTEPGDLVLDPYAGSGTTLRVAGRLGRRAIGIEAHEPFCEAMVASLDG